MSLFSVTNPERRIIRGGFEGKVPKMSQEMANPFLSSALCQANHDAIEDYRHRSVGNTECMDAYRQSVVMDILV